MANPTAKPQPVSKIHTDRSRLEREHIDQPKDESPQRDRVEEASDESFPASDPPASHSGTIA